MTDSSTPSPKLLLVALAILVTGFPSLALADVYLSEFTHRARIRQSGPVPGVTLGCGRVKTNAIIVLRPSHQPVAVIAASLTILLR